MGRRRGTQFRLGSFYRTCERSGFTSRAEDTRAEWTGSIVESRFWEARQPQDFVKGVKDNQTVPNPRSENPPVWDGPIMAQLAGNVAIGATFWPLESTYGFSVGGAVGLMMDNGVVFTTTIRGGPTAVTATGINVLAGPPYMAASGNIVTAYEATL